MDCTDHVAITVYLFGLKFSQKIIKNKLAYACNTAHVYLLDTVFSLIDIKLKDYISEETKQSHVIARQRLPILVAHMRFPGVWILPASQQQGNPNA